MSTTTKYLSMLQSKVFKLLPMREARDRGEENHLDTYVENLYANLSGAFLTDESLSGNGAIIEVHNNIAYLKANVDVDFAKWRAIVLRSTRLVHSAIEKAGDDDGRRDNPDLLGNVSS